jgi:uncharacterized protein
MFQKLLLIIAVAAAVWFGIKAYRRFEAMQRQRDTRERGCTQNGPLVAHEMVKCPRCGTYVAGPRPGRCERADCPYAA